MGITLTPKIGLEKPDYEEPRYDLPINRNFDKLDDLVCKCPAINNQLTSVAPVDVFIYDTRLDSDKGSWRHNCSHLSWYNEQLNTSTRGSRRDFPAIVGIVAESNKVTLYDLTDPATPMWMVFNTGTNKYLLGPALTSVTMLNGVLVVGQATNGLMITDFVADKNIAQILKSSTGFRVILPISGRENNDSAYREQDVTAVIVNDNVNDVAMTTIGGQWEPVIAVATDGGVSVIDGPAGLDTVVNMTCSQAGYTVTPNVSFSVEGHLNYGFDDGSQAGSRYVRVQYVLPSIDTEITTSSYAKELSDEFYRSNSSGSNSDLPLLPSNFPRTSIANAIGSREGLTLIANDIVTPANGMVSYVTKDYQSGLLQGATRGAFLADTVSGALADTDPVADRSVYEDNMLVVGDSIVRTAVASGADLVDYSGFSSSAYIEQAYNANFDFGTSDFCIMAWARPESVNATRYLAARGNGDLSKRLGIRFTADGSVQGIYDAGDGTITVSSPAGVVANGRYMVAFVRRANDILIYVNGVQLGSSDVTGKAGISDINAVFQVGKNPEGTSFFHGVICLARVGASAPSDEQIAKIYEDEKALFNENTRCTLQGTSSDVTCLDFNPDTQELIAGTASGSTIFNGLAATKEEVCIRQTDGSIICTEDEIYISVAARMHTTLHGVVNMTVVSSEELSIKEALIDLGGALQGKQDIGAPLAPLELIDFIPSSLAPTPLEGRVYYDLDKHALSVFSDVDMTLNLGQEEIIRVINDSGSTIVNARAVYVTGTLNGLPTIELAIADSFPTSRVAGVTTHEILDGQEGFITYAGSLGGNFSGLQLTEALYLSDTIPGGFTNTPPDIVTKMGVVTLADPDGKMQVKIANHVQLPTTIGYMNNGAIGVLPVTIGTTQVPIANYTNSGSIVTVIDATAGTIATPTTGTYRLSATFNITFTDVANNSGTLTLHIMKEAVEAFSVSFGIPKNVESANVTVSAPNDVTAGDVYHLEVSSTTDLAVQTINASSFDVESINIR